jgi:hypothetical protein
VKANLEPAFKCERVLLFICFVYKIVELLNVFSKRGLALLEVV